MINILRTAALSAAIGLTALAAVPAAHADNLYLGIGVGDDGYRDRDRDDSYRYRDRDDDGFRDRDRDRDRDRRGFGPRCSPDRALDKAGRMGVRYARIRFVGPRLIGVVGRNHGRRVEVTFGRAPFCPVVG